MKTIPAIRLLTILATAWLAVTLFTGCAKEKETKSDEKAAAPAVPVAPANVTLLPADKQVTLTWQLLTGAQSYNVYVGSALDVTTASGTKQANVTSPLVLSGLNNGTASYYVVTAVNSAGESDESVPVCGTPHATASATPAIACAYVDQWSTLQLITDTVWSDSWGDVFHILQVDNASAFLVAQNDALNAYNPSLYSRFDWTWNSDALYYCQSIYSAATQSAAAAGPGGDPANLAAGCGGFSWTRLQ
jgi:hypothetical protein